MRCFPKGCKSYTIDARGQLHGPVKTKRPSWVGNVPYTHVVTGHGPWNKIIVQPRGSMRWHLFVWSDDAADWVWHGAQKEKDAVIMRALLMP